MAHILAYDDFDCLPVHTPPLTHPAKPPMAALRVCFWIAPGTLVPGGRIAGLGRRLIPLSGVLFGPLPTHARAEAGLFDTSLLNIFRIIRGF